MAVACLWGHTGTAEGHSFLSITVVNIKTETTFPHPVWVSSFPCCSSVTTGTLSPWASEVSLPAIHLQTLIFLLQTGPLWGWDAESGDRVGGFPSEGPEQGEVGGRCLWSGGRSGLCFNTLAVGTALLDMPPAPVSGRAALMSDSCWRPLPLWLYGVPIFCGPGLLTQRGLHWAPASPCRHDRHQMAFTARCLPPTSA